jgi:isoleucyl-tRNA synthetase
VNADFDYWQAISSVKTAVNGVLEEQRKEGVIGGSLSASVTLFADDEVLAKLQRLGDELRFVLITSQAVLAPIAGAPEAAIATDVSGLKVLVTKSAGQKCSRCYHFIEDVGESADHPEICGRCITNVDGDGESRLHA